MRAGRRAMAITVLAVLLGGCMADPGRDEDVPISAGGGADCDIHASSPPNWPAKELAAFSVSPYGNPSKEPNTDTSTKGMVVGTTGPLAIRAGRKVLENCGSAIDAALTTAFTQITLAAGSWVSFAGISSLLYYEAASGTVTSVDAGWNAMLQEKSPNTIPTLVVPSGRTVLVHGMMDAAGEAHQRWGRLPWWSLFEPSIWVAEKGMTIDSGFSSLLAARSAYILRTPEGREIFLKQDGTPYRTGDTFRQPHLAKTLHALAEGDHRYFYEGPWAEKWVALVNREGGVATLEDLERYKASVLGPATGDVHGLTLLGPVAPQGNAKGMLAGLRALESAGLKKMGTPYDSARALFTELRAWAQADSAAIEPSGGHSDAVVAVDSEGNIAALTHTINAVAWGSNGIFVDGVSIADSASFQQERIARAGPGGRIPNEMTPTMLLDSGGTPILATSAVGSSLEEITFNRLVDVVEYGQPLTRAVFNPSFHLQRTAILGEYNPALLMAVRAMGEPIPEVPDNAAALRGYFVGVQIDWETGMIDGANGGDLNGRADGVD